MDAGFTRAAAFPETPWTKIGLAGGDDTIARSSLEALCRMYWAPLYAYARRNGLSAAEAEDITQSYFVQMLEKGTIGSVDREKGKLRSYLLGGLKHFLLNWRRDEAAVKRGGRLLRVEFDTAEVEQVCAARSAGLTPEECFERQWAASLLDHALRDLESEVQAAGKGSQFAILSEFLLLHGKDAHHGEAAEKLGMSEANVRVTVHRLRQRFRDKIRAHVAATVTHESEVDAELKHLVALFAATSA